MQYHWKNHMWNIISCLIIPKSLTYLFIVFIYKYCCHLQVSLIRRKVYGTIVIAALIPIEQQRFWELNNDAHESVRHTFNCEALCCYNNYPFTHSNADVKHSSRDQATWLTMYWIEWLEDESAVWDIQIDTKMMLDADAQYSIGDTIMRRRYQE